MFFRKQREIEKLKNELREVKRDNFRLRNDNHALRIENKYKRIEKVGVELTLPSETDYEFDKYVIANSLAKAIVDYMFVVMEPKKDNPFLKKVTASIEVVVRGRI